MQKSAVRDAIIAQLQRELDLQTRAAHAAREEATSEESKSEGKYDMRGQEAAYLAEGQARLALELTESLTLYHGIDLAEPPANAPAAVGALVTLEARGKQTLYFVGPRNGGLEAQVGDISFTVITPSSPLGRQIVGQRVGASVQLPGRGGPVQHKIVEVR
ncbi:MAG: GreA/GreB family elongation factor [Rariglobus sp.]|nr:GreA/GreB family elongation factor [Rariglobus sp.]